MVVEDPMPHESLELVQISLDLEAALRPEKLLSQIRPRLPPPVDEEVGGGDRLEAYVRHEDLSFVHEEVEKLAHVSLEFGERAG
jgi:hypothetical protein